jgi:hypothetical protein
MFWDPGVEAVAAAIMASLQIFNWAHQKCLQN